MFVQFSHQLFNAQKTEKLQHLIEIHRIFLSDIMDRIDKNKIQFNLPFRISVAGDMGCGKSTFCVNLAKQFKEQTNVKELNVDYEMIFCTAGNTQSTR